MGLDISGFAEFADELEEFADATERASDRGDEALDAGVRRTAEDVRDEAQRNTPRDTNELAESAHIEQISTGAWLVVFEADHAASVEYGSGPHLIVADKADALRFEVNGEVIFRKAVNHPGSDPSPFLRPALDANRNELARRVKEEFSRVLAEELD